MDETNNIIEGVNNGVTTQMTDDPGSSGGGTTITLFEVLSSSYVNGEVSTLTFRVVADLAISDSSTLIFEFPSELSVPNPLSCSAQTNLEGVTCSNSGTNGVSVTLDFEGSGINSAVIFAFDISKIKNP